MASKTKEVVPFGMRSSPLQDLTESKSCSAGLAFGSRNLGSWTTSIFAKDLKEKVNLQLPDFWKYARQIGTEVAFPNILLDTIASSTTRICSFRLTRGTP